MSFETRENQTRVGGPSLGTGWEFPFCFCDAVGQPAIFDDVFTVFLQRLQSFDANFQGGGILGLGGKNHVGEVQSLDRFA